MASTNKMNNMYRTNWFKGRNNLRESYITPMIFGIKNNLNTVLKKQQFIWTRISASCDATKF